MKILRTVIVAVITLSASAFAGDWALVSATATAFKAEEATSNLSNDFWLHIELRNDSKSIQYVQGLRPGWFKIEAFVRRPKSGTWERENMGVDGKLEWISIQPGEKIKLTRRQSDTDIGLPMMLTFHRSWSDGDRTGTRILLDPFTVPAPPKRP